MRSLIVARPLVHAFRVDSPGDSRTMSNPEDRWAIMAAQTPGGDVARAREFDTHVFISYAHMDNQPLTPDQQGWVSRFHASLEVMLSMRLGRKAEIWRDKKLAGNDIFADEIVAQFPRPRCSFRC
jgi:hypothetical protein